MNSLMRMLLWFFLHDRKIRNHPSDGDELLTMKVIEMIKTVAGVLMNKMIKMIATVAGGGGAILDDDILSAESEAVGRS